MYTNEWMWRINIGPDTTGNTKSITIEIPVKDNTYTNITDWTADKKFINKFTKRRYDWLTKQYLLYNCIVYAMIGQTSTTINCSMTGPNVANVNSKSVTLDNWPPNDTTWPNEPVFVWTSDNSSKCGIWKLFKNTYICMDFNPKKIGELFSVETRKNDHNYCAPEAYRSLRHHNNILGSKLKAISYNHFDLNGDLIVLWFNIYGKPMYCITPIAPYLSDQCKSESKLIPFMSHCFQDKLPTFRTTTVSDIESNGSTVMTNTTIDTKTTTTTAVSVSPTEPLVVQSNTGLILLIVIISLIIVIVVAVVVVLIVLSIYLKNKRIRKQRLNKNQLSRHRNQLSRHRNQLSRHQKTKSNFKSINNSN
ncbi:uncharacterized protein LOC128956911 [Oppia nitens]|uniref:uncharacterized protein LOC128956911 n=1 Tax=Oppia nitens TaxID=1686743 RepID=UPI0023DA5252|nr:uncharacterized protein LOC128956911 [Oppia nitens]